MTENVANTRNSKPKTVQKCGCVHEFDYESLLGLGEVATLLSVSRQRAHQLTKIEGFPVPVRRLVSTSVWLRDEVIAWDASRIRPSRRGVDPIHSDSDDGAQEFRSAYPVYS
jgi:predicted DNA-binding transcriptional regulator AlpA